MPFKRADVNKREMRYSKSFVTRIKAPVQAPLFSIRELTATAEMIASISGVRTEPTSLILKGTRR